MIKIILWIFCILIAAKGFSQKIILLDKSDLQPVKGAVVYDMQKKKHIESNAKGEIDLSSFSDNDTVCIRHITYQLLKETKKNILGQGTELYLTDNVIRLDEVVFSANKAEEKKSDLPNKIDVISAKQIAFNNPQTSGDLLQQTGNVFIQQSQMGGSSPVIRGFEANKVLLVMDGVRMNNAIYRSGHLQNVITIDPCILDRTEIVYGPGSVIYGSDALGGVMHFYSRNPELSKEDKMNFKAGVMGRYASACNEKSGNLNFNIGLKKWGFLTSISYKDLGDLRTGGAKNPFQFASASDDFGKCLYYYEQVNGKDSMMTNSDPLIQRNTGYKQYDILQKIMFQPSEKMRFILNVQFSNTGNVPRYDRLTDMSSGKLKYAEWYYGPQTRLFSSLRAEIMDTCKIFDNLFITLGWQDISEDRVTRKFTVSASPKTRDAQEETVNVYTVNADLMKKFGKGHELRYGLDIMYNTVVSKAYSTNILTGVEKMNIATRYPDNGSTYDCNALYITHSWEINPKFIFSQGIRGSYVMLNAEYSDTMMKITKFPFDKRIEQQNGAITGNLGLVYSPGQDWRFALSASSGFRAPNVDDVGKVNDSKAPLLVIPNPGLKPEYAYNFDLTIGKIIKKKIQLEATGFYTIITNATMLRPTQLNGADSVIFGGTKCQALTNKNESKAFITGFQGNILAQITSGFSAQANITYTYARVRDTLPLDHIPPVFGLASVKYETKKFKGDFYVRFNGDKLLKDYYLNAEDNEQYATPTGMPGWYTLNLKFAYQVNKYMQVQMGMENILDVRYRHFASGISAPGRNLILALRGNF
ncbi:MAG: TonB-dependent receptor [Bacteroidia bacterium]|nr:TonB-dependent receptor [Bacteroidia bacterium]